LKIVISIWTGVILLLSLLAAGWLVSKSQVDFQDSVRVDHSGIKPFPQVQLKIKGKVLEYGSNPDGDIDKMILSTDEQKFWIHFPPHTARAVAAEAPVNSLVEVTMEQSGPAHKEHLPVYELKYLRKQSFPMGIDLEEFQAPRPKEGFEIEVKGKAPRDFEILRGQGRNFILSGKLISIPLHMEHELFPLIDQAKTIRVKGYLRDSTDGFLSVSGMPVVKASSIQLDSVTYKIR
jgi:hypothetical protein